MESFENKFIRTENILKNIRGIFDKNQVEIKLKNIEKELLKENFWKDKDLVKKIIKQKKSFEEILNSYKKSLMK